MSDLAPLIDRLRRDDPDRLAMALLAPAAARSRLVTLYALNAELARTALSARDPMVAEIRVQWWVDRLQASADGAPPPHELLTPLWAAWGPEAAGMTGLAEARRHDAAREPFTDPLEVVAYADATGGALMQLAARAAGAEGPAVLAQGRAAALTAWLRARPALQALGLGLARPDAAALRALADSAARAFAVARAARREVPAAAAPVLFAGAAPRAVLAAAQEGRDPAPPSEFRRRAALLRLALTGQWWV